MSSRSSIGGRQVPDRKSTRLNSSHTLISYAVFCLKKKSTRLNSRSEEHTSELQSHSHFVCRLLLDKKDFARTAPPLPRPCRRESPGRTNRRRCPLFLKIRLSTDPSALSLLAALRT